ASSLSEPPHEADDHPLHRDVTGKGIDRAHHRVRRLQADAFSLVVKTFQSHFTIDVCDDHLAVVGALPPGDDHQVAVENAVIDHRVAAHFEDIVLAARG